MVLLKVEPCRSPLPSENDACVGYPAADFSVSTGTHFLPPRVQSTCGSPGSASTLGWYPIATLEKTATEYDRNTGIKWLSCTEK
jgi:hypothetical protein